MIAAETPNSPELCENAGLPEFRAAYLQAMIAGSGRLAERVIERALNTGVTANDVYLGIFQPAAYEVGRLWQLNKFTVAQEHLATAIIERQMGDMHGFFRPQRQTSRTVVIGCVDKEHHRVGSRMVADFFEQAGWSVYYLGAAVPAPSFIAILKETGADLAGVSAQMLYHVPAVRDFVAEAGRQGLAGVPIMAGGLPFVQQPELYRTLGIRFSGLDARAAVSAAESLIGPQGREK